MRFNSEGFAVKKGLLFAVMFIVLGGILLALFAPLVCRVVFPDADIDYRKLGEASGRILMPVFGLIGFCVGYCTRKKERGNKK